MILEKLQTEKLTETADQRLISSTTINSVAASLLELLLLNIIRSALCTLHTVCSTTVLCPVADDPVTGLLSQH